jgi:serine/threonine protein kinase
VLVGEERDRGHVCTFSALVVKSRSAYLFHVGDTRISRLVGASLEPLTEEHRAYVSSAEIYLARALGADRNIDVEYGIVPIQPGDVFVLSTDGVHDHLPSGEAARIILANADDLDRAAQLMAERGAELGSADDLTVQIVRIEALPDGSACELVEEGRALPPAPLLEPGQQFEGFEILRTVNSNSRSHIYLARDIPTGMRVALKIPSTELREDADHMRRLALEEWVARRVSSPHVLAAADVRRPRGHLFVAMEYVDGISLDQWMRDNPRPDLEPVRRIVEQIGRGLHAFHRREMLHQDLRPKNVIIDDNGVPKIIDFGSAWIAGIAEAGVRDHPAAMLGTVQYSAPEYLLGEAGDERSDIFSLGVICYQMLTGELPFGTRRIALGDRKAVRRLNYTSARRFHDAVPEWVDAAIAKAVAPERDKRYEVLSEFLYDLRHPNSALPVPERGALLERRPEVRPWILIALLIGAVLILGWHNHRLSVALDEMRSNSPSAQVPD